MEELIRRITENAGISTKQAETALFTIKDFIKEQFPMLAGAVDNFLPGGEPGAAEDKPAGLDKDELGGILGGDIR